MQMYDIIADELLTGIYVIRAPLTGYYGRLVLSFIQKLTQKQPDFRMVCSLKKD